MERLTGRKSLLLIRMEEGAHGGAFWKDQVDRSAAYATRHC
jgi:S-adenosylmethionine synthetase